MAPSGPLYRRLGLKGFVTGKTSDWELQTRYLSIKIGYLVDEYHNLTKQEVKRRGTEIFHEYGGKIWGRCEEDRANLFQANELSAEGLYPVDLFYDDPAHQARLVPISRYVTTTLLICVQVFCPTSLR